MRYFQLFISFLDQLIKLITQLKCDLVNEHSVPSAFEESGNLEFDDAHRRIYWNGGSCPFTYRKAKRYDFVFLLWERVGEHVPAEEVVASLFDKAHWKWTSVRRFGIRVQEDDLDPHNCPFRIRIDAEGFTLLPTS